MNKQNPSKSKNPNNTVNRIVDNFKKTGKYSSVFLRDLKEGLSDFEKYRVWKSK